MSTPTKKYSQTSHSFIPKEITSPNKDTPGISRTVYSHISNIHSLLSDWLKIKNRGVKICRAISALDLHECKHDYYPHQLNSLMGSLGDATDGLKDIVEGSRVIKDQLLALAKLQPTDQPVIYSWSTKQIHENVDEIYSSLQKEYKLKEIVTENIAHCRDEKLIEVYASSWEFEAYINYELSAYLFAEVGLPGIM